MVSLGLGRKLRPRRKDANSGVSSSLDESAPVGKKKRKKETSSVISAVLETSLCALRESADAFPPLKSAAGGTAFLFDRRKIMKGCQDEAHQIINWMNEMHELISRIIPEGTETHASLRLDLTDLDSKFDKASADVDRFLKKRVLKRFFEALDDKDRLSILRKELESAMEHLKISTVILTGITVVDMKTTLQANQAYSRQYDTPRLTTAFTFARLYRGSDLF